MSDAWMLFTAFAGAGLLPASFDAEVSKDDSKAWALFCFSLWTLDHKRRPHNVVNELLGDGINAWTEYGNESSNAVEWIHDVLTNFDLAMNLEGIQFDLSNQVLKATFKDGQERNFRNRRAATPWSPGSTLTRSINNNPIKTKGNAVFWHLAGFFCGHISREENAEFAESSEIMPLVEVGNYYKR